jgi:hypothetical protein
MQIERSDACAIDLAPGGRKSASGQRHGNLPPGSADGMGKSAEWERAQRASTPDFSTMPLYYAIRAYKQKLNREPLLISTAASDDTLFRQISELMEAKNLDRGKQIRNAVEELQGMFREAKDVSSNPTVAAAKVTAQSEWRKAILAFVLGFATALLTLAGVLLTNWDKTPWGAKKAQAPCVTTSAPAKQ